MKAPAEGLAVGLLIGTIGSLFGQEDAAALSPADLLTSCEAITGMSSLPREKTLNIPASGLPCWYYMSAVQNMTVLAGERGERLLGICPPPDSTVFDFVRIFVKQAHMQNVGSERNAAAVVLLELARAFLC